MNLKRSIGIACLGIVTLHANAATSYSFLDLGTLGGATTVATALNNLGQVVGYAATASNNQHAFVTGANGLGITDLGTLGGSSSAAAGINDLGQVVGSAALAGNAATHAFIWKNNGPGLTDLGTLGGTSSSASGINNAGQVVGVSAMPAGGPVKNTSHAFIASGAGMKDIGTLQTPSETSGTGSVNLKAVGINASGQVAGSAATDFFLYDETNNYYHRSGGSDGSDYHGFVSSANGLSWTDIGNYGRPSFAFLVRGLSDSGRLVGGYSYESRGVLSHAFLTGANGQGFVDLGTLGGRFSEALGINEANEVVGSSEISNTGIVRHAFVVKDGVMSDLNSFVQLDGGAYLAAAQAINEGGQIIASDNVGRAYLLTPSVPEPGTLCLLLAGWGVTTVFARRRAAQPSAT